MQVLEGTERLVPRDTSIVFSGEPARVPVGPGWLGRVCNGGERSTAGRRSRGGDGPRQRSPLNPTHRARPTDPVLTGISAIDALTTWCAARSCDLLGGSLPHLELAGQIAAQSSAGADPFSVVFAGMGLTHADADAVRDVLEERLAAGELLLLLNTADDPVIERILTPRIALTVAEHLAFELDRHVWWSWPT